MKNNFRIKKLALATALILSVSSLAACGKSATTTTASTEKAASTETAAGTEKAAGTETAATEQSSKQVVTIKAATGGAPKPYIFLDENNQPDGYDIAVLKEVFTKLPQYKLDLEVTDFPSIFAGLTSGLYQIGVNNFSYNQERAKSYLYSYPYDKVSYVFVTKPGAAIHSFAEAAGKSFEGGTGVSVTTAVESWNTANPDKSIGISYTDSDTSVILQHVVDGSTGFDIIDKAMFEAYQKEFNYDLIATDIPADEAKKIADNSYAYFILSQDQTQLRDDIDGALKELQADGTLTKLSQQYFGGDYSPEADQYVKTLN